MCPDTNRTGTTGCQGSLTRFEAIPHGRNNLSAGGQDTEKGRGTGVDDDLVANKDFEFSVAASHHFDLGVQLATQTARHTDGVESCDSIRTEANADPWHVRNRHGDIPYSQGKQPPKPTRCEIETECYNVADIHNHKLLSSL